MRAYVMLTPGFCKRTMIISLLRILLIGLLSLSTACSLVPTAETPVSENSAVRALVEQAVTEREAGKLAAAAAALERALRIEPRNPRVWQELARVRLVEGDAAQAEQLAVRAVTWAGDDRSVRAASWRLIAEARATRGDRAGADEAFARARQYEH
jgi:predicted Zn-dependent protease